ncbi:hypothetical protein ANAPC1_01231 [Anaplasma phagocytophilum]|uniref:Uncharacterized protein n=1 Tax=Anaplasma phagocytophilum TaxID=948 RepID=A0AA45UTZ3_ANAPH|nr:hypothetical protein [Anaplasma phagocytophilum]SBO14859.1 hypothetical protein ANAPC1_01231 [Anaplasma phagocytophilum]SBO33993.1 hypothetical protein ANAPC4_01430 [Anaplasma phagocytophilum]
MKISHPDIDKKVCTGTHAKAKDAHSSQTTFDRDAAAQPNTAQCSGLTAEGGKKFSDFAKDVGLKDNKNWPTGKYTTSSAGKEGDTSSNAKAVAKDLVDLKHGEKTIVAGLLAKTIEGGEVVEICLSTST